jgi:hypothetical protein
MSVLHTSLPPLRIKKSREKYPRLAKNKKTVGDDQVCPRRMTHCLGYKRGGQTPIKKLKKPPSLKSLNPMMNDIPYLPGPRYKTGAAPLSRKYFPDQGRFVNFSLL